MQTRHLGGGGLICSVCARVSFSVSTLWVSPPSRLQLFRDFLQSTVACGLMLSWGGTPATLFIDNEVRSVEIVGTVILGISKGGDSTPIASFARRPSSRTALGMLGGIERGRIKEDYVRRMTADGGWEFLHIVTDSAAVNYKMMRLIVADTMDPDRLLVVCTPCEAHILSNCVEWALRKGLDYGKLLRSWN